MNFFFYFIKTLLTLVPYFHDYQLRFITTIHSLSLFLFSCFLLLFTYSSNFLQLTKFFPINHMFSYLSQFYYHNSHLFSPLVFDFSWFISIIPCNVSNFLKLFYFFTIFHDYFNYFLHYPLFPLIFHFLVLFPKELNSLSTTSFHCLNWVSFPIIFFYSPRYWLIV